MSQASGERTVGVQEQGLGLPSERERIAGFQEALSRVAVRPLTTRPDINRPDPVAEAKEAFFRTDFQPQPTFYGLPEISHELADDLLGFEPFVSSSDKASRHGVFFGALVFSDGLEVDVAVKPHYVNAGDTSSRREAETSCLDDYFANVSAKDCGFDGLEPVGFILDEDGCPYSLTVLDKDLKSLDSIDWTHFFEPGYETTGMREILYKTALQAALLHDSGDSFHGDLAPRNVGTDPFGHVALHDWEKGKATKAPSPDVEERFGKTWQDIQAFMLGLVKPRSASQPGVGMFENCSGDWWDNFKDVFLDDYLEARKTLASQGSHHMRKLKDTESELGQLELALHLEIDKWQPK